MFIDMLAAKIAEYKIIKKSMIKTDTINRYNQVHTLWFKKKSLICNFSAR